MLIYGVFGVILGGRLGYVLFYKPEHYLAHPVEILQIWTGGMSFHGGFLGVLAGIALFCWIRHKRWITTMDFLAPLVPPGLAAGRLGNFINGELPEGRPTCRGDGSCRSIASRCCAIRSSTSSRSRAPRFARCVFSSKPRPAGAVSGAFLVGYGVLRFVAEFSRQPDDFLGLLALGLSMGQWLSLPMILAGLAFLAWAYRRK
jgi:phosphatidylglycerol:prolipoprotein diacylglycerol transferase